MKVLVVVDMQNDFISGSLGTQEACTIVPKLADYIRKFDGRVIATRDTHSEDYLDSMEGKKLPVIHCVKGTEGWDIHPQIRDALEETRTWILTIDKPTFGSVQLGESLRRLQEEKGSVEEVVLTGVCTDICVISNALLIKAYLPETEVTVDASLCAGVTLQSHRQALEAMKMCQITIINE